MKLLRALTVLIVTFICAVIGTIVATFLIAKLNPLIDIWLAAVIFALTFVCFTVSGFRLIRVWVR